MSAVYFELGNVLTRLLSSYNITEAELSRKVNLPRATINRLVNGKTPDPRASTLDAISKFFNISVDQLLGKKPIVLGDTINEIDNSATTIPIIDWSKINIWQEIIDNLKPENHKEWITTNYSNGKKLFCVKVSSEAMWPKFENNTVLIIDPNKQPLNQSFIVVHIQARDEIIFRQLIIDGQCKILKALNPIFPSIELQKNDKIIGAVVETRCNFN